MKCFYVRCSLAISLLLGCAFIVSAQEGAKHSITFDDLIKLHRIAEPQVSPDGKWVAYTVSTPDMEANRGASNIWVVPTAGGAGMQLTQSGHDSSPVWSPDGHSLFYRGVTSNKMMVASVTLGTAFHAATPRPLFDGAGYESVFAIEPGGKRLLMMPLIPTEQLATQINLVQNFITELRARVK